MPFPKCAGESSVFKIYHFQNLQAKNVPFSCDRSLNLRYPIKSTTQAMHNLIILITRRDPSSTVTVKVTEWHNQHHNKRPGS